MKKIAFLFLGVPLTLFALNSQANTYTVTFFNPTTVMMTEKVTPNNNATHIECSGDCTSLPPNSKATYTISSNASTIPPFGSFTATFGYSQSSNYCDTAIEGMMFNYNISNYSFGTADFFINVGETLPNGLYGSVTITKKCAEYN